MLTTAQDPKTRHRIARSVAALIHSDAFQHIYSQHLWAWTQWNVDAYGQTFPPAQDRAEIRDLKVMQQWSIDRKRSRSPSESAILDLDRYNFANALAHATLTIHTEE